MSGARVAAATRVVRQAGPSSARTVGGRPWSRAYLVSDVPDRGPHEGDEAKAGHAADDDGPQRDARQADHGAAARAAAARVSCSAAARSSQHTLASCTVKCRILDGKSEVVRSGHAPARAWRALSLWRADAPPFAIGASNSAADAPIGCLGPNTPDAPAIALGGASDARGKAAELLLRCKPSFDDCVCAARDLPARSAASAYRPRVSPARCCCCCSAPAAGPCCSPESLVCART